MSRNSARGFAVVSATAVTTVGAVMGVAQAGTAQTADDAATTASDSTLLADLPLGEQAQVQTASLTQQADTQAVAADASAKKVAEESARKAAAKTAVARQQAAKEAAAKAKQEKEAKAASASYPQQASYTVAEVQALARQIVPSDQFQCFSNIVDHESTWNYRAQNPSSGAYGLVQALPGSKMSSAGADWQTNPATQIKWGLNYMNVRYGSPCDAWTYWQANGSY
ncbi:lytic transglycosylase domain-containing protein [Streptomyces sp. NPDC047072]|uniref:aggregation-promoting factor C-terminal-like domain-containing protein n=1 Tax=Streptomyces sp. NPDC047072 TaxID=3154809 RepID=UPI0033F7CDAA